MRRRPHGRPPPRARRAHEAPRAAALPPGDGWPHSARAGGVLRARACMHSCVRAQKEKRGHRFTKRNETKRNEAKRNETKRNETKRNETKREKKKSLGRSKTIGSERPQMPSRFRPRTMPIERCCTDDSSKQLTRDRRFFGFWGGGGERGRDRQKDGPRGGGSLRPTSPSAVTTFGAHHHRRGGAHGRRPLEGPASSARGPSWARPAGGKRTPVGPPPPHGAIALGRRREGSRGSSRHPAAGTHGRAWDGGGPRADAGPAGGGDERPHAAAHVRRHEGSKKGPQKKCTKGHRARETLATGNPPQGRAPGQGRGGPTGGGGGGAGRPRRAHGQRQKEKKKKKEKRKKGDRSAEQGLNLRGSWEHAHSAPYNTPFLT